MIGSEPLFLLCLKKSGPMGQVRDIWLSLGVLCLKSQFNRVKYLIFVIWNLTYYI